MTSSGARTIHASAVQIGDRAVLIRGPSGAGKSRLAFDLISIAAAGHTSNTVLIGDDRVFVEARENELVVRHAPELAGLIEVRGLGIRRCEFVLEGIAGLVVDLAADDAERHPTPTALTTMINGVILPRIPVGRSYAALPLVVAALRTKPVTVI